MKTLCIALGALVALQPVAALAAPAKPAAPKAGPAMPPSPLSEKELKDALKALGPKGKKLKVPTFKKGATAEQKKARIQRLDSLVAKVKAAKATPPHIQSGVRVWEALSAGQKEAVLSGDALADPTVTGWVAVAIAVVAFAYYVADTQDYVGDDPPKDKEGGDDGGDEEPTDGGDTGSITLDY